LECHGRDDGSNTVTSKIKKAATGCLYRNFPEKNCTSDGYFGQG
jgi:hypothetical protein